MSRRRAQREEAKAEFLRANPHLPDHETTVEIEQRVPDGSPVNQIGLDDYAVVFDQDGVVNGDAIYTSSFSPFFEYVSMETIQAPHFALTSNTPFGLNISEDGINVLDADLNSLTGDIDFITSGDEVLSLEIFEQNNEFFASLPSPTPVEPKGGKSVEFDVQAAGAGGVTVTLLDDDGTILIERMFETTTNGEQNFSVEVEAPQGVFFDEAQIQAIGGTEFTVTGLSFTTNFEVDFMQIA